MFHAVDSPPTKEAARSDHILTNQTDLKFFKLHLHHAQPENPAMLKSHFLFFLAFLNLDKRPLIGCNESAS